MSARPRCVRAHMDDPGAADALWTHLRDFCRRSGRVRPSTCACSSRRRATWPRPARSSRPPPCSRRCSTRSTATCSRPTLAGELTGTVALAGAGGLWCPNADPVKTFVPEAAHVDRVVVVGPGPAVTIVESPPVRYVETIDSSRRLFEVDTTGLDGPSAPIDAAAIESVVDRATRGRRRRDGRHRAPAVRDDAAVREGTRPVRRARSARSRRSSTSSPTWRSTSSGRGARSTTPR